MRFGLTVQADYMYNVGMKSIQYTVRNVPATVDKLLRRRAKDQGKSFNQLLVETLQAGSGLKTGSRVEYDDLDWFIGGHKLDKKAFDDAQEWLDNVPNRLA